MVNLVRLAPECPGPLAGLLEQMSPGYLAVVRRVKAAVIDVLADRVVQVADQAPIERQAGQRCQVAFAGAERHVDPGRVAPLGGDVSMPDDQAGRATARLR